MLSCKSSVFAVYSHFFEEIAVRDGLQLLNDEVDPTLDEECLVCCHGARQQPQVSALCCLGDVSKL